MGLVFPQGTEHEDDFIDTILQAEGNLWQHLLVCEITHRR